jgi:hypothetical protein
MWSVFHSHRHFLSPDSTCRIAPLVHVNRQASNMMYQPQIDARESQPVFSRAQAKLWEGWVACHAPEVDLALNLWRQQQLRRSGASAGRLVTGSRRVHIIATAIVLGAISAAKTLSLVWIKCRPVLAYHCGNVSSQRMCRFLQVLQPLRDLVWLFLGGPPPGPAMVSEVEPSSRLKLILEDKFVGAQAKARCSVAVSWK